MLINTSKIILLGLSIFSLTGCSTESMGNGINRALIGTYYCKKGRASATLQLAENGKFQYMSNENFMSYTGDWEAGDGDDRLGDINTKNKLSDGSYQTLSHNYQKKQKRSLVIFFNESVFNSKYTCKFTRKDTSI